MATSIEMSGKTADVLIMAAHAPELVGLRPHLKEQLMREVAGLFVVAKTIGVGMGVAGVGAANRLHQLSPRCVILLGSCGVFPGAGDYKPLDIIVPDRCHLLDHAATAGTSEFPGPMQTTLDCHRGISERLVSAGTDCRLAPVATTMAITTDDPTARGVHGATGFHGENLELFPVALACHAAKIPVAAVLGVTNLVGSTGRKDWAAYQRDAAIRAAEVIITWLHNGAQGLPHQVR